MYIIRLIGTKEEVDNFDYIDDAINKLIELEKENLLKCKPILNIYEIFKKEHDTIETKEN